MRSCRDEALTARVRPPRRLCRGVAPHAPRLPGRAGPRRGRSPAWAQPGVTVSESALTVPEGSSLTYTIVLNTRPSAAVYVTVARNASGDADITATPFSLVFTTGNWNTAQEVTVAAAADPRRQSTAPPLDLATTSSASATPTTRASPSPASRSPKTTARRRGAGERDVGGPGRGRGAGGRLRPPTRSSSPPARCTRCPSRCRRSAIPT